MRKLVYLVFFLVFVCILSLSGCETDDTHPTTIPTIIPTTVAPTETQPTEPAPTAPAHVHAMTSNWESDENTHMNFCECGEVMISGAHTFGEWGTTMHGSCTRDGERARRCSTCNYRVIEVIPAPGHTIVATKGAAATCTKIGAVGGKHCEKCATVVEVQKKVFPQGHCYENDVCTVCGEKRGKDGMVFTLNADGASYTVSGDASFKGDTLVIPGTYNGLPVTQIADKGFQYMKSFKTLVIADGIKKVGWAAFSGCSNVELIAIAPSVERTSDETFEYCGGANKRLSIYISSLEQWLSAGVGHAACGAARYNLYIDSVLAKDVVLPSTITELCGAAFRRCDSIRSVTVPENVTVIGSYAFGDCANLRIVNLSEGLKEIDTFAFCSCTALQHLVLPSTVKTLGKKAFDSCENMRFIVIPRSVEKIADMAFVLCKNLTIYCEAESKPSGWGKYWNNWGGGRPTFWGGEWQYVDGVPTPINHKSLPMVAKIPRL